MSNVVSSHMINLAIVGCGGMATSHLEAYAKIKEKEPSKFELVSLCDPVQTSLTNFTKKASELFGKEPQTFLSLTDMLKHTQPDAIDICTPHSEHHTVAISALKSGANVMIEKPLGITINASKAIIAAGKRYRKIVATAENIRRGINQRTMHWIINDSKLIGRPRMFYAIHASWEDPSRPRKWHWRVDKMLGGGGMIMDSGAHFCDSLRYFFGDIDRVYAFVGQSERWPHNKDDEVRMDEREDSWMATLTFKSGLVGFWSWTMAAPGQSFTKVVYYGSDGCLVDSGDVFHGPFDNAVLYAKDGTQRTMQQLQHDFLNSMDQGMRDSLFPHGFTEGVVLECYDFLDAIQKGRRPEVDGETGMRAKAIAEAIYESSRSGSAVRYDDVLSGKVSRYQDKIDRHYGLAKRRR